MNINTMTRRDFYKLPARKRWDEESECAALVIVPAEIKVVDVLWYKVRLALNKLLPSVFKHPEIYEINGMHDSGYRCMSFVAVDGDILTRVITCSDVVHIDGIGGFGDDWLKRYGTVPRFVPPSGWSIDCLMKSGFLRLFPATHKIKLGIALSSFEIFAMPADKTKGG